LLVAGEQPVGKKWIFAFLRIGGITEDSLGNCNFSRRISGAWS